MKPFDKKHTSLTLKALADQGIEFTPKELEEYEKEVMSKLRKALIAKGFDFVDKLNDSEVFLLCYEVLKNE